MNFGGKTVVSSKPLLRSNCFTIIFWENFIVSFFYLYLDCTWVCLSSVITAFYFILYEIFFSIEPTSITSTDWSSWAGDCKTNEFEVSFSVPCYSEKSILFSSTIPRIWSFFYLCTRDWQQQEATGFSISTKLLLSGNTVSSFQHDLWPCWCMGVSFFPLKRAFISNRAIICSLGEPRTAKCKFWDEFAVRLSINSGTFSFISWTNKTSLLTFKHYSWRIFTLLQCNLLALLKAFLSFNISERIYLHALFSKN